MFVKATACIEEPDGQKQAHGWARHADTKKGMDASQITGSASSYARKYALNGLFLIDDCKDDDTRQPTDSNGNGFQRKTPAKTSDKNKKTSDERATIEDWAKLHNKEKDAKFSAKDQEQYERFLEEKFETKTLTHNNITTTLKNFGKSVNSFRKWQKEKAEDDFPF